MEKLSYNIISQVPSQINDEGFPKTDSAQIRVKLVIDGDKISFIVYSPTPKLSDELLSRLGFQEVGIVLCG